MAKLYESIIDKGTVTFTNTENMSRSDWLSLRRKGIGGSDAGAIMGLNKYATPLSVYLAKKEAAQNAGNSATEWGNILEEPVRQKTREELGCRIETVEGMFTSADYPFMNANLDGLIYFDKETQIGGGVAKGLCGHEIKTSRTGDGFADDEIPDSYYAQIQHYMAVTGIKTFILTVFIFDRYTGRHYVVPRNEDFIARLIDAEKTFWERNILSDAMPAPTGNENETELLKNLPMAETVTLDEESEAILDEKSRLDAEIKTLQEQSDILKEKILIKMTKMPSGIPMAKAVAGSEAWKVSLAIPPVNTVAECGAWKISLTTQTAKRIDTAALKKAGIYEQYAKKSVSRVLRITRARSGIIGDYEQV